MNGLRTRVRQISDLPRLSRPPAIGLQPEPTRSQRDAGYTLTEMVVSIVLIGVLILPIMSAVIMSIRSSSLARSAAQVETMVVNAADRINRAEPKQCRYDSFARAAVVSQQWNENLVQVSHAYYAPATGPDGQVDLGAAGTWVWGETACALDEPSELEVQLIRIRITSPDGKVSREIEVVKSDV